MSDPMTPEVREWMKRTDAEPPDAQQSARQVMTGLPEVRQRRRWWPFPVFYRKAQTPSSTNSAESQSTSIPSANGQTPTVLGRTTSMLSPVKAITAGALVFAIGGAFLIAQPFDDGDSVPGAAEADVSEAVPFTLRFYSEQGLFRIPETTTENGIMRLEGRCGDMTVTNSTDPRLDGKVTYCFDENRYLAGTFSISHDTYRIATEDGAWQGSSQDAAWDDPESGDRVEPGDFILLVGEGDYEGFNAVMELGEDWPEVRGVIFEGPPPAAPVPPIDE